MRRRGAVDEAVVLLAEAVLMAGLLLLASRLWLARYDPYPEAVARLLNATPPDAEWFIVLPKPARIEVGRVCCAGECYAVPITRKAGAAAWWWVRAQRDAGGIIVMVGG